MSSDDWRAGLERWSWALLAVVRRYPWLLRVPLSRPPMGPGRFAWLDRGLQALAQTALTEDEKAAIILLLNGLVFNEARLADDLERAARERKGLSDDGMQAYGALLSELVQQDRYPALRRALDAGIFDPSDDDRDAGFKFGLERLLDGVDRLVVQRAANHEPPSERG